MIIDAHMHADCRPIEDFKSIKMGGVDAVISCAHDPLEMSQSIVSIEHLNRIVYDEPKRVESQGVKMFAAVGVHPRAIAQDYDVVIDKLPEYLKEEHVICVGEIGLETTSDLEQEVFIKQLKIIDLYDIIINV